MLSLRNAADELKDENKVVQTHPVSVPTWLQGGNFIVA